MYTKTFYLEVYRSDSGTEDEIPVVIAVTMDLIRAQKILSRMKLVGEIEKVDPDIHSLIFKDEEAKWYGAMDDEGNPSLSSEITVYDPKMRVSKEAVYWEAGIEDTSLVLDSEMIYISRIKSVADGKDPDVPPMADIIQMQWIDSPFETMPVTEQAVVETPPIQEEGDEDEGP